MTSSYGTTIKLNIPSRDERLLPEAGVRWNSSTGKLQQKWLVELREGLSLKDMFFEWRDVPTVTEQDCLDPKEAPDA